MYNKIEHRIRMWQRSLKYIMLNRVPSTDTYLVHSTVRTLKILYKHLQNIIIDFDLQHEWWSS